MKRKALVRLIAPVLLVAALLPILCSCKKKPQYVVMEFEDYGGVLLELDPNNAPITVENFVSLVSRGFYAMLFHQIRLILGNSAVDHFAKQRIHPFHFIPSLPPK